MTIEPWAVELVQAILNAAWQGVLVVAATDAVARLAAGRRAGARSVIWLGGFALVAGLPLLNLLNGRWVEGDAAFEAVTSPNVQLPTGAPGWPDGGWISKVSIEFPGEAAGLIIGATTALVGVGLLRALLLIGSTHGVRKLRQEAKALPPSLARIVDPLHTLHGRRGVRVLLSEGVGVPCTLGFIRPVVLLPVALLDVLTEEEWKGIVVHELAHVRRYDDWSNLAQRLMERLFFYLPAVRWAARRLDLAREIACDELVLSGGVGRRSYAGCLTRLAERRHYGEPTLATSARGGRGDLTQRVEKILGVAEPPRTAPGRGVLLLPASFTFLAGAWLLPGIGISLDEAPVALAPVAVVGLAAPRPLAVPDASPATPPSTAGDRTVVAVESGLPGSEDALTRAEEPGPVPRLDIPTLTASCLDCAPELPRAELVSVPERAAREPRGRLEPLPPVRSDRRGSGAPLQLTIGVVGGSPGSVDVSRGAAYGALGKADPGFRLPSWLRVRRGSAPLSYRSGGALRW
ncbi:MAG: hypothetical protein GEU90_06310 [Gemmatimonas sp.]|nr:hypothetical protein [Gemmatimonas sp.]